MCIVLALCLSSVRAISNSSIPNPSADNTTVSISGGFIEENRPQWKENLDFATIIILTANTINLMLGMGSATCWKEVRHSLRHGISDVLEGGEAHMCSVTQFTEQLFQGKQQKKLELEYRINRRKSRSPFRGFSYSSNYICMRSQLNIS